jgi:hypothetical protein
MEISPHLFFSLFFLMKTGMILSILATMTLVATTSAMTMTDDAMMKKDTMSADTMDKSMMKDAMMKEDKMMMVDSAMMMKKQNAMSTALLAKTMGYTWMKDRATLASKAGIVGYRGTVKQNLMIRSYLMGMMKDKMMKDSAMMKDDKMMKDVMTK